MTRFLTVVRSSGEDLGNLPNNADIEMTAANNSDIHFQFPQRQNMADSTAGLPIAEGFLGTPLARDLAISRVSEQLPLQTRFNVYSYPQPVSGVPDGKAVSIKPI
jgi:hypothetical protein